LYEFYEQISNHSDEDRFAEDVVMYGNAIIVGGKFRENPRGIGFSSGPGHIPCSKADEMSWSGQRLWPLLMTIAPSLVKVGISGRFICSGTRTVVVFAQFGYNPAAHSVVVLAKLACQCWFAGLTRFGPRRHHLLMTPKYLAECRTGNRTSSSYYFGEYRT
jgi:hypothetical protein